jgi:hypothetical protein
MAKSQRLHSPANLPHLTFPCHALMNALVKPSQDLNYGNGSDYDSHLCLTVNIAIALIIIAILFNMTAIPIDMTAFCMSMMSSCMPILRIPNPIGATITT